MLAGCGPAGPKVYPISGTVTYEDGSIPQGEIVEVQFTPISPAQKASPATGAIGADAEKLCRHFGGEILYPANCAEIYRRYRTKAAVQLVREGRTVADVADVLGVHPRTVRDACAADGMRDGI